MYFCLHECIYAQIYVCVSMENHTRWVWQRCVVFCMCVCTHICTYVRIHVYVCSVDMHNHTGCESAMSGLSLSAMYIEPTNRKRYVMAIIDSLDEVSRLHVRCLLSSTKGSCKNRALFIWQGVFLYVFSSDSFSRERKNTINSFWKLDDCES
jgi:hypothetical protein